MSEKKLFYSTRQIKSLCSQAQQETLMREYHSYDGRRGIAAVEKIGRCVETTAEWWPPFIFAFILYFKMIRARSKAHWESEYSSERACMGGAIFAVEFVLYKVILFRFFMWCQHELLLVIALIGVTVFAVFYL